MLGEEFVVLSAETMRSTVSQTGGVFVNLDSTSSEAFASSAQPILSMTHPWKYVERIVEEMRFTVRRRGSVSANRAIT